MRMERTEEAWVYRLSVNRRILSVSMILAIAVLGCGSVRRPSQSTLNLGLHEMFICPTEPALCSWSSESGWKVIWRAEEGTERAHLSLFHNSGFLRVLWRWAPYGGTFLVFSVDGRLLSRLEQGAPMEPGACIGDDGDGAVVLCTGRQPTQIACTAWIFGQTIPRQPSPDFPTDCLFPRLVDGKAFCIEDPEPFRDPASLFRISIWEDYYKIQDSVKHTLKLPAGFIRDFMPLGDGRALFAYEDGRVFEVESWSEVKGPILTETLRFQRSFGRVYIIRAPLFGREGEILRVDGPEFKSLWKGSEVPAEVVAISESELLVSLEEPRGKLRSRLLLLQEGKGGGIKSRVLWADR
jgi:hypothetical protein